MGKEDNMLKKEIYLSGMPIEKKSFDELLKEAQGLGGSLGREVTLKATNAAGRQMIYLSKDKKNVGLFRPLTEEEKTDGAEIFRLLEEGKCIAHISSVSEDGKLLGVTVEETEEKIVDLADKNKAKTAIEKLEVLLGKKEVEDRINYMKTFNLTEKMFPTLYSDFLEKIAKTVEGTKKAGEELPEKPSTLYITSNKKDDGNALLSLSRGWVTWRPTCLEGQKGLGKDVAFESFAWLTGCRLITLQWHGRTTRGDAVCHETTDNSLKEKMSIEGLVEALNWFNQGIVSKLFKREDKTEKAASFILNTLKSLSPSLKMENGPIMEALELANRGVGVILLNDEMNLGEPNFQTGTLNYLCDGHTPEIYVGGKGIVTINREYFFTGATQNGVGGDYVGTHKLNDALASRFKFVKMESPTTILGILRTAGVEVSEETYKIIDDIYNTYMEGVSSGIFPQSSLNIRGLKSAILDVYYGASIKTAVAENVNNSVQNNDDTELLNTAVDGQLKKA